MDLSPPPTTTTAAVKTPDAETETPTRILSNNLSKHLPPPPLTNGVLKRHKPLHHHQPRPVVVTYKECLKNHAATIGGHAVDGCGEFMPSPTSTPTHPTSLKCAACGCHRNFHRRDPDESSSSPHHHPHHNNPPVQHVIEYQSHHRHHPPPPPRAAAAGSPPNSPSPPPISSSYYPSAPHMLLALSAGLSAPPVDNHHHQHHHPSIAGSGSTPNGKKRFRTKFTQNQKEKMQEFAERLGWKMQKRDEEMILGFCSQIGVEKGVFKVWMHNNKINKKNLTNNNDSSGGVNLFDLFSPRNNLENGGNNHHGGAGNHRDGDLQLHNNDSVSTGGNVNGSSSSS